MSDDFARLIEFRSGDDFPEWARDGVTTRATVTLSWRDRIRLLFGFRLEFDTFTATENKVGRTESRSCVFISNPRRRLHADTQAEAGKTNGPGEPRRTS